MGSSDGPRARRGDRPVLSLLTGGGGHDAGPVPAARGPRLRAVGPEATGPGAIEPAGTGSGATGPTGTGPTGTGSDDTGSGAAEDAEARAIALRHLTAGPRSRAELAARLAQRGVGADVARSVLDQLHDVGLVDDAEFARTWVSARQAKGLSARAVTHELRVKGVDPEVASLAVEAMDADTERVAAEQLVLRKVASVRGLPRDTQVRRLGGILARKGYSSTVIMQVVLAALDDVDGE